MSEDTKSFLLSKTLWGIVVAGVAQILARRGITLDVMGWTNDIASLVGLALGIYGRLVATSRLTLKSDSN